MDGLSLLADGELFAVDVMRIQKVVRNMAFTPVPAAPDEVVGIANLKGGIVTLISLAELFGHSRSAKAVHAVIFKSSTGENSQMGLLVDSPGNLVTIDETGIIPPHFTAEECEKTFISGLAEVEGMLYRIIDIDAIKNKLKERGKKTANSILQGDIEDD